MDLKMDNGTNTTDASSKFLEDAHDSDAKVLASVFVIYKIGI